jgi:hypothetical protein
VETSAVTQAGSSREQVGQLPEKRGSMKDFLSKTRASSVFASVAEYVVMLFVAVMTGVSTLRLLGILP